MATDLEKLVVQLSADFKSFEKGLAQANGVTNKQFNAIERRARQMNKNLDGIFARSFKGLASPLAGVGAVLGTAQLIKLTDTWTDLNSRVKLAAGSLDQGAAAMQRLSEVARRTYSSLEQTAEGYLLNATAMRELGYSTSQTLDYTESVNNALVISGAKGQRAETVMNALSKAMAGGALKGENLNTVIEQGGRLAEALAAGLGVGVNQLRALGTQGKITGRDIVSALSKQMEKLRTEAEAMPATIGDGIQLLQNALLEYVGNADHATGISAKISEALVIMADNFDKTADTALQFAAVIAGALIGRSLLKMISTLGLAGTALVNFTRALAAARTMGGLAASFGGLSAAAGPVGVLIGGAVVASLVLFSSSTAEASEGAKRFADRLEEISKRAEGSADKVEAAGQRYNEALKNALGHENKAAQAQFEDAHRAAMKLLDAAIEAAPALKLVRDEAGNLSRQPMASQDQIDDLHRVRGELKANGDGAEAAKQELYALANSNPNFQQLADQLTPLLDHLALVAKGAREAAAELAAAGTRMAGGRGPSSRGGAGNARRALDARKEESRIWESEQTRRAQLGKDQLALENEIARVKKQAADDGIRVTDDQIKRIAEANLAGNTRRSGEGKKTPEPKKTADDRFDNLTQSIYDRIAAMKIEADTTGLVYQEQEKRRMALDLEQEALAFVREEARKKGDQDWQNAKLSPEQVAAIDKASDAYARQADALRLVQEEQGRAEDAAQEFYGTFKSGMIDAITGAQSFSDALSGILKKLGDMVLNSAFDQLFSGATQSGGWLTGLFKMAGFASGTANTGGVRGQPMGIVHGQEAVIPLPAGGSVPVKIQAPQMPRIQGAGSGGAVSVPISIQIDAKGADREGLIRVEQQVDRLRRDLPGQIDHRMATARQRNFKGR